MPSSTPTRNRLVGPNIPPIERLATGLLGIGLTAFGLRRKRSVVGQLALGVGAFALERAVTGSCPLYRAMAVRDTVVDWRSGDLLATVGRTFGRSLDLQSVRFS